MTYYLPRLQAHQQIHQETGAKISVTFPEHKGQLAKDSNIDDLSSRLYNWKFRSALLYLDQGINPRVRKLVTDLAYEYGNIGWVEGKIAERICDVLDEIVEIQPEIDLED